MTNLIAFKKPNLVRVFVLYGWAISILFLYSIIFVFHHGSVHRLSALFSIVFGMGLIYAVRKYILNIDFAVIKSNFIDQLLRNLFLILISLLILQKYNTYEFKFSELAFHAGFSFGNFTDFYAAPMYALSDGWSNVLTSNGYFPFANILAIISGYLMGWNGVKLNYGLSQFIYLSYFTICFSPLLIRLNYSNFSHLNKFLFLIITFLSYPVLFAYERGNYVLITFFLLQIYFFTNNLKTKNVIMAFVFSLKLLNVIFLPLLLKKELKEISSILIGAFLIQLLSVGILTIIYGPLNIEIFIQLAKNVFGGSNFTDGMKVAVGGGLDTIYISFKHLLNGNLSDGYSEIKNFRFVSMFFSIALLFLYCYRTRNSFSEVKYIAFSVLTLYLLHPLAIDYNLILVFLVFVVILFDETLSGAENNKLLALLSLFLIGFYCFPLISIACCGSPVIPGRGVSLSLKPFMLFFSSIALLTHLLTNVKK